MYCRLELGLQERLRGGVCWGEQLKEADKNLDWVMPAGQAIDHRNSAGSNGAVAAGGQITHAGHRIAQCWSRKTGAPIRPL